MRYLLPLLVFGSLLFTGCSSSTDVPVLDTTPPSTYFFTASLGAFDGKAAREFVADTTTLLATKSSGVVSLTARNKTSGEEYFQFNLTNIEKGKTYSFSPSSGADQITFQLTVFDAGFSTGLAPGNGTCTITKLGTNFIEGTFSCTVKSSSGSSITCTNGQFAVKLNEI